MMSSSMEPRAARGHDRRDPPKVMSDHASQSAAKAPEGAPSSTSADPMSQAVSVPRSRVQSHPRGQGAAEPPVGEVPELWCIAYPHSATRAKSHALTASGCSSMAR